MSASPRTAFRNHIESMAYGLARATIGRGGPGILEPVGTALGTLFHLVTGERKDIIRFNLKLAFPELSEARRRALAFKVAQHFGRALMSTLRVQRMNPRQLLDSITVEGREHLDTVIDSGRGWIVLSAHVGAWEVAALFAGLTLPGGFSVVHRPLDNPLLEARLEAFRHLFGNRTLGKKSVLRAMLSELKAERTVGILIDQRIRRKDTGVEVPFFGHPARTHSMLARLVLKTRTPVIPLFAYAEPRGRFTVSFGPPVPVRDDDDEVSLTTRYTAVTEAAIRRRPEQWLWYHDRWRPLRLGEGPFDDERR